MRYLGSRELKKLCGCFLAGLWRLTVPYSPLWFLKLEEQKVSLSFFLPVSLPLTLLVQSPRKANTVVIIQILAAQVKIATVWVRLPQPVCELQENNVLAAGQMIKDTKGLLPQGLSSTDSSISFLSPLCLIVPTHPSPRLRKQK